MQYIVKKGDTLAQIAKANNTTVATLKRLNPSITDVTKIHEGQQITLPTKKTPIAKQTKTLGKVCGNSSCKPEYVDLLHLNQERKFIPLTAAEQAEFEQEEAIVAQLINQFTHSVNALSQQGTTSAEIAKQKQQLYKQLTANLNDGHGAIISTPSQVDSEQVAELDSVDLFKIKEVRRLAGEHRYNYVRTGRFKHQFERDEYAAANSEQQAEIAGWYDKTTRKVKPKEMLKSIKNFDVKWYEKEQKYPFFDWALCEWKDEHNWPNAGPIDIKVTREASLLRFAANASASIGFNPVERSFTFGAKANAQFSLAQAKAETIFRWPAENKSEITINYTNAQTKLQEIISLGHIRTYIRIAVSGFAGATIALAANVNASMKNGIPSVRGTTRGNLFSNDKTGGSVDAFVGAKAGTEVEGGIDWIDTLTKQKDWLSLVKLGQKIEAAAGAGLKLAFKIGFDDRSGQFYFLVAAGVIVGVGASGEIAGEFNMANVSTMAHFIYNALLKVDFHKIEIFANQGAWDTFCNMGLYALVAGVKMVDAAASFVAKAWGSIINTLERLFSSSGWSEDQALKLATNILADIPLGEHSWVRHTPPEVKGRLLWMLCYKNTLSWSKKGNNAAQDAVAQLLMTSQGSRDLQEMICRMNPKGTKGSQQDLNNNTTKVCEFLADSKYQYLNGITEKILENYLKAKQQAIANEPVITQRLVTQAGVYAMRTGKPHDGYIV